MSITTPDDRITAYSPITPTMKFPADFPVFDNDDLKVFVDGVERTDFSFSATYVQGISSDARAVFSPGITGTVRVVGARDSRRTNRFSNGASLLIWAQNLALDTVQAENQEQAREVGRAVKSELGEKGPTLVAGIPNGASLMKDGETIRGGPNPEIEAGAWREAVETEAVTRAAADAAEASARSIGDLAVASLIGQLGPTERPDFDSRLAASMANISPVRQSLQTGGYAIAGDKVPAHYVRTTAADVEGLSPDVFFQSLDGSYWVRGKDAPSQGVFRLIDYLTPRQMHLIEQYDYDRQDPSENVASLRAMFDDGIAWLQALSPGSRSVRWELPAGLIAIDAEIFSPTFNHNTTSTFWPSHTCSFAIHGSAANQGTVIAVKNWKHLASIRTGGRWCGQLMPEAMFRWGQSWPFGGGPEIKNVTFKGTGVPGQDPIGLWMSQINNAAFDRVTVYNVRNHGHFFERIENSDFNGLKFLFCGYQPTKARGDGFIPAGALFNASGTNLGVPAAARGCSRQTMLANGYGSSRQARTEALRRADHGVQQP